MLQEKMSLLSTKWVKLTPEISHYFGSWHLGYKIARQEAFGKIVKEVEGFITRERESDKREKNCDLTFMQFFAGLSRAVYKIIQLTQSGLGFFRACKSGGRCPPPPPPPPPVKFDTDNLDH